MTKEALVLQLMKIENGTREQIRKIQSAADQIAFEFIRSYLKICDPYEIGDVIEYISRGSQIKTKGEIIKKLYFTFENKDIIQPAYGVDCIVYEISETVYYSQISNPLPLKEGE